MKLVNSLVSDNVNDCCRVVSLVLKRPQHFKFRPGDYIFVNIPEIAMFEWHPFTISSAPEESNEISLHIRVVGHWTNKLYEYFESEQKRLQAVVEGTPGPLIQSKHGRFYLAMTRIWKRISKATARKESALSDTANRTNIVTQNFRYMRRKPTIISYQPPEGALLTINQRYHFLYTLLGEHDGVIVGDNMVLESINDDPEQNQVHETILTRPLTVYIDGPFEAPTSQIFQAEHAVLIGTGIGVTPFASILQSIMHRYWAVRRTCPKCQHTWSTDISSLIGLNLQKVGCLYYSRINNFP